MKVSPRDRHEYMVARSERETLPQDPWSVVFHFYVLMMLVLLARTAASLDRQLWTTLPNEADQELYRARVENAVFLQLLVGMKSERAGVNAALLGLIALITIVLAPLATRILMQMMFLPHHHLAITWWHRALIVVDLVLIIVMWRRFFCDSGVESPLLPFRNRPRLRLGLGLAIVVWLSFWEGRWAGEPGVGRTNLDATANGVVFGLFPERLKLKNETIVDKKTLEEIATEIASD
jgi:hypothetical protein